MISTDRKILEENSEVRQRMIEYSKLVSELHIIVFFKWKYGFSGRKIKFSANGSIYPTSSWSKWFYIFSAIKIGRNIIKKDPTKMDYYVVTTQDPFECGLAGYILKTMFSKKTRLQLQIHTDFLNPYFVQHSMLHRVRVLIARFLIPRANCIRVVSERIKKSLSAINYQLSSKISVLPVFIDVEKIKNFPVKISLRDKYPQFDFIILMASRLTKEKNIGMAAEVIGNLVKRYPKIGLIIVGDGPDEKNLKLKIKNLKLDNNVILEGWTDDLVSYYKTASLFLITSYYEGYSRTAIEALICGCMVVMTDVGVAGELVKNNENGLIIPVNNKIELERAVLKMINDKVLHAKISLASESIEIKLPAKISYFKNLKRSWQNYQQDI
ncbi:MAG: glycosyltransferase family 4 protein [Patescibacteria group bacterium]